jgi:hypothetical protein
VYPDVGHANVPGCHTQTVIADGTHKPLVQLPLIGPGSHPCAYFVKVAADVSVEFEPAQLAPVAVVGLPVRAEALTLEHVVSRTRGVRAPRQLSWPNSLALIPDAGHVPFVPAEHVHGVQVDGADTVTPPATFESGFGHAPGQPIDGLFPVSRTMGPVHPPGGIAGAHMPEQTTPLEELELEELELELEELELEELELDELELEELALELEELELELEELELELVLAELVLEKLVLDELELVLEELVLEELLLDAAPPAPEVDDLALDDMVPPAPPVLAEPLLELVDLLEEGPGPTLLVGAAPTPVPPLPAPWSV